MQKREPKDSAQRSDANNHVPKAMCGFVLSTVLNEENPTRSFVQKRRLEASAYIEDAQNHMPKIMHPSVLSIVLSPINNETNIKTSVVAEKKAKGLCTEAGCAEPRAEGNASYCSEHRAKNNERANKHKRHRRKTDPEFQAMEAARASSRRATKPYFPDSKTADDLGCPYKDFKVHIRSQFHKVLNRETRRMEMMTWKNRGKLWVIDHYIPLAKFNLTDRIEGRKCTYYKNLRPMCKYENGIKGHAIPPEITDLETYKAQMPYSTINL